jgi:hypothetical protein
VHTNSAVDAIMRLVDLGAERYSIATGLMAVIHQRLVRRLCPHCKEPFDYPRPIVDRLMFAGVLQDRSSTPLLRGVGCDACHGSGFRGRIGIYELLNVNEQVKYAIATGVEPAALRQVALSNGALYDLARYSREILARGDTAPTEVLHLAEQGVSSSDAFRGTGAALQSPALQSLVPRDAPAISLPIVDPAASGGSRVDAPKLSAVPRSAPASAHSAPASPSPQPVRDDAIAIDLEMPRASDPGPLPRVSASPRAEPGPRMSGPAPRTNPAAAKSMSPPSPRPSPLPQMSPPAPAPLPRTSRTAPAPEPTKKAEAGDATPPVLDLDLFGESE